MARVLLTWELGGGLGHMMNLRPLAAELTARGHKVFLAAGDLAQAPAVFGQTPVTLLPAPWKTRLTKTTDTIVTYADLLLNIGFGDGDLLVAHLSAWRNLFDLVQPDLVVCDHSPTALLAARGQRFAVATVGTGFFCPIDEAPLRLMRKVTQDEVAAVRAREQRLLDIINSALAARGAPVDRVTQLYHDGRTRHFLLTYPELDHFYGREGGDFRGALPYGLNGQAFLRPGDGPCVFAYLKPFPALVEFLGLLAKLPIGAVVYIDGLREETKARFRSDRLHFADGPVDIRQAAAGCDAAVTNGNSATCTAMLLAGKPLVNVPPFLEQWLFAAATDRLGASITAKATDAAGIAEATQRVLAEPRYAEAAREFAQRHRDECLETIAPGIVDDLEKMIVAAQ